MNEFPYPTRLGPAADSGDLDPVPGAVVGRGRGRNPQLLGQAAPALDPHGHHLLDVDLLDPDLDPQPRPLIG
jgi:hypothetical protein